MSRVRRLPSPHFFAPAFVPLPKTIRFNLLFLEAFLAISKAQAELIVNGSFEAGDYSPVSGDSFVTLSAGSINLTGWTVAGAGIDWHKNSYEIHCAFDGAKIVDLNRSGLGLADTGILPQIFPTIVGQGYNLSFDMAGPNTSFPNPRQVRVNIAGIEQIFSVPVSNNLALIWEETQFPFFASGTTTTLQFSRVNGAGFWGPFLDEVSVSAVPEPCVLDLVATGLLAGLAYTRCRDGMRGTIATFDRLRCRI